MSKKIEPIVPYKLIAELVGTSADNVKKVCHGQRGVANRGKAKLVKIVAEYFQDYMGKEIAKVKLMIKDRKEILGAE